MKIIISTKLAVLVWLLSQIGELPHRRSKKLFKWKYINKIKVKTITWGREILRGDYFAAPKCTAKINRTRNMISGPF